MRYLQILICLLLTSCADPWMNNPYFTVDYVYDDVGQKYNNHKFMPKDYAYYVKLRERGVVGPIRGPFRPFKYERIEGYDTPMKK